MKERILILSLVFLLSLIVGTGLVNAYYMMGYGYPYHMGYYGGSYSRGYYGSPYGYYEPYSGYGGYSSGFLVRPVGLFRSRYYSPYLIGRAFDNIEYDRISDYSLITQSNVFNFIDSQNNIRPRGIYY